MQYTYEIKEAPDGWIVDILKDNFIIIHQPHHPQQNLETDGPLWKSLEAATAWAEESVNSMNNPPAEVGAVMAEKEEVEQVKEIQVDTVKAHLASLLNVSIDQIQITPPPSEE